MILPLILSENVLQTARTLRGEVLLRPQRWRQKINAVGWYDNARFQVFGGKLELEKWFNNYLGWHAVRHDPTGLEMEPVFEGMVWAMTLHLPGMAQTISLDDLANTVSVRYTPTDFSQDPPTTSDTILTAFANETESRAKYGIKHEVLQRGRLDSTMAEQERDTYITEYGWPKARKRSASTRRSRLDVTLKGYWHTLDFQTYSYTDDSLKQNASTEILEVKTEGADEFINDTDIDTNTFQVNRYYDRPDEIRTKREIMEEIAFFGDTNDERWVVGVKENRTLYYRASETDAPIYFRRSTDPAHLIRHVNGHVVEPWLVRPDHLIRTMDIDPLGSFGIASLKQDPQINYIESVEWREPYGLKMEDSRGQRIEALMAKNVMKGEEAFRREFA